MIAIGLWEISQRDDTIHQVNLQKSYELLPLSRIRLHHLVEHRLCASPFHLFRLRCLHIPDVIQAHLREDFLIPIYLVAAIDSIMVLLGLP